MGTSMKARAHASSSGRCASIPAACMNRACCMAGADRNLTKEIQMSPASLFVRKASGLVRAWSVFDAFIYATFSINLITLGLFIFSYCYYLDGSLITGVVVGGFFSVFEVS